jgi:hypothetical protein
VAFFNGTRAQGFAFSVGSIGGYSIDFKSLLPGVVGRLRHDESFSFDAALPEDNFFPITDDVLFATPTPTPTPTPRPSTTPTPTPTPVPTDTSRFVASPALSVSSRLEVSAVPARSQRLLGSEVIGHSRSLFESTEPFTSSDAFTLSNPQMRSMLQQSSPPSDSGSLRPTSLAAPMEMDAASSPSLTGMIVLVCVVGGVLSGVLGFFWLRRSSRRAEASSGEVMPFAPLLRGEEATPANGSVEEFSSDGIPQAKSDE